MPHMPNLCGLLINIKSVFSFGLMRAIENADDRHLSQNHVFDLKRPQNGYFIERLWVFFYACEKVKVNILKDGVTKVVIYA